MAATEPVGNRYVGRFAPSPTGELHLGSLVTAVASYLHSRQNHGEWLLRVENIDPPRETPGAVDSILRTIDALELHWDRDVIFQSDHLERFESATSRLLGQSLAFHCTCSRHNIRAATGSRRYPGTCRNGIHPTKEVATSVRVLVLSGDIEFEDGLQGPVYSDITKTDGDYLIYRRDGLPAYHLAVVLDDAHGGITDVVRGVDLLDQTAIHIHLQRLLGLETPTYWHLPVLQDAAGEKLSKQTGADGISADQVAGLAPKLLRYLGLSPPAELELAAPSTLWDWAVPRWDIQRHRQQKSISA